MTNTGTLMTNKSKNVTAATLVGLNTYCFDLAVPVTNGVATILGASGEISVTDNATGCASGFDFKVNTYSSTGGDSGRSFMVAFN